MQLYTHVDRVARELLAGGYKPDQALVYCSELPTMEQYGEQIHAAGFVDLQITDMSTSWQHFVRQRLDEFRQGQCRYETLHGADAYAALEGFYAVIVDLFESGGLGGLRWTARRPD